jgi:hypothetical protein
MNGNRAKMNMEIQKKWFVYVGDHHEGPFSVDEVRQKQIAGVVGKDSYVWAEGMADWQMLSQVQELANELSALHQKTQYLASQSENEVRKSISPKADLTNGTGSYRTLTSAEAKNSANLKRSGAPVGKMIGIVAGTLVVLFALSVLGLAMVSRTSNDELHTAFRPTLVSMVDRFPFLSSTFRLVPQFTDLKPEDQKELEDAQVGLPENGVKLAIALSKNDPNRPFFYLSSNLPHGTKLDALLIGNNETLLNRLQYNTQVPVVLQHGIGKTEILLAEGGQPLPKGEYTLFVSESNDQDEAIAHAFADYTPSRVQTKMTLVPSSSHFLFSKTVFIGGERDQTYLTRLKAFHDKVKANAERELLELKQYADTLQLQYTTLTTEFGKVAKNSKISPAAKANWKRSTTQWQQINAQLEQTISTWTKETLQNEYFYGKVYELVKSAFESLKSLYTLENNYVDAPSDPTSFQIQQGKALSEAREAMDVLRAKVELILKAPKTSSGLPTREGI